jgi:hypothetical protein
MSRIFWSLFSDSMTRNLFETIVKERKINYRDLIETVNFEGQDPAERLEKLEQAHLIATSTAPLKDFETYYVTANGLSVERELRRQTSDVVGSTINGTTKKATM